jgi:hypothetical protein
MILIGISVEGGMMRGVMLIVFLGRSEFSSLGLLES